MSYQQKSIHGVRPCENWAHGQRILGDSPHEKSVDQVLHFERVGAEEFVRDFCRNRRVALVTDGAAYTLSGSAAFFDPLVPEALRIVVKAPNPKVEGVQALLDEIRGESIGAFIAVGGGTAIETTKLLNFAMSTGLSVRELLQQKSCPTLLPFLGVPTTAGTGAEATRFAVCYDGDTKYSIDFPEIRPSHVLLLAELSASLPAYQKLSTNFDAYAQAVESLWAKGATEESKAYAQKALDYMAAEDWPQGAYWAGRAIDLSRTTAAHAFSYYLTSHYGIPHGHAVYMVFEYICRNNGRPDRVKIVPGLKTLREFVAEKGIAWSRMVDALFDHVNLKRLGNNPVEVRKEYFNG